MPAIETAELGRIEFADHEVYNFPQGLPAFEHLRAFLLVRQSHLLPLAFLVSTEQPGLRFICVPVEAIAPGYELQLSEPERELLEWEGDATQRIVLAVLTFESGKPATANLVAPVVLNVRRGLGVQVVQADCPYCVATPLPAGAAA